MFDKCNIYCSATYDVVQKRRNKSFYLLSVLQKKKVFFDLKELIDVLNMPNSTKLQHSVKIRF